MDIRAYFQKIRETERNLADPFVVVVSIETPEGGKAGRTTEVSRASAAKLIVEGKVRLADEIERTDFYTHAKAALAAAEEEKLAGRIQLTVLSEQASRFVKPRAEKG